MPRASRLALFVITMPLFFSPAFADSTPSACNCPSGTEHVLLKTPKAIAEAPYFPQAEEYCQKKVAGRVLKEGPYILWGPNGERFEDGQYADDKKTGTWTHWAPDRITSETWVAGRAVDGSWKNLGSPRTYTIDCDACVKQAYHLGCGLGSTNYEVLGAHGDSCWISHQTEIEMGYGPRITVHVPRKLGRLTFPFGDACIDFSSLDPFVREVGPTPPAVWELDLDELPVAVHTVVPVYPDSAKSLGITGPVVLRVLIGEDGRVRNVQITQSVPMLDRAAVDAIRQWVFRPGAKNGKAVEAWVVIPVRFDPR